MNILGRAVSRLVRNPLGWNILNRTVVRLGLGVFQHRRYFDTRTGPVDLIEAANVLSPDWTVLHGPFKGIRYPQLESCGSVLFPKLLGSYERELHPWIEECDKRGYGTVVDVGCAEGYYAVGLARRWPNIEVHAFDTDVKAQRACIEMARCNEVADRVHMNAHCDEKTLRGLELPAPSLIISDCEGYEAQLFTEALIHDLRAHDFLIELHDWFDITISPMLKERFGRTHNVRSVYSVDDIQKVHVYDYPELKLWDMHERRTLLREMRPYVMEWIFCMAKNN